MTHISRLNRESVLETRLEHLEQLSIVPIVADVIEDVLVGNNVERSEDDDDRNVVSNVRKRSDDLGSALHSAPASVVATESEDEADERIAQKSATSF